MLAKISDHVGSAIIHPSHLVVHHSAFNHAGSDSLMSPQLGISNSGHFNSIPNILIGVPVPGGPPDEPGS